MGINSGSLIGDVVGANLKTAQILEKDLQRHIHLKCNILFKKAVIFEDE